MISLVNVIKSAVNYIVCLLKTSKDAYKKGKCNVRIFNFFPRENQNQRKIYTFLEKLIDLGVILYLFP